MRLNAGLNDVMDMTPITPGKYNFIVKEPLNVEPVQGKTSDIGTAVFVVKAVCTIEGGSFDGRQMTRRFSTNSKASRYFLKTFLDKIGVNVQADGSFSTEEVLGKKFSAAVEERSYEADGQTKKASDIDESTIVRLA